MNTQTVQHVVTNTYTKDNLIEMILEYACIYNDAGTVIELIAENLTAQQLLDIAESFDCLAL